MKQIKMTVDAWIEVNDNPQQRNTEFHAKKAMKNHLADFSDTQCTVAAAELPSGVKYKLDGHTRALLWEQGLLDRPKVLFCDLYECKTIKEVVELYEHFDNSFAVDTASDKLSGAFKLFGIPKESKIWALGGCTTALKAIYTNQGKGISRVDIKTCIEPFIQTMKFIDNAGYTHFNFPSPVLAAMILSVHKDGNTALSFWDAYNSDEGRKTTKSMDAIYCMTNQIRRYRSEGDFVRGSRNAVFKCVPKMLGIYEKWGSHMFKKSPDPEGNFRYYVQKYCEDVFDKLNWTEDGRKASAEQPKAEKPKAEKSKAEKPKAEKPKAAKKKK